MSLETSPRVADWLEVDGERLIIHTGKVDIGQRISSALVQIASEELTLPIERIDVAPVRTGRSPDEGITSGSNSVQQSGRALRMAAATLRVWLQSFLEETESEGPWLLDAGMFRHTGRNVTHELIDLMKARDFGRLLVDLEAPCLAPASEIPSPPMRGMSQMVTGDFRFVHDIEAPDMWHARVVRPPHARARLARIDEKKLSRVRKEGFSVLVDGSFVAVAGEKEWPVIRAAARIGTACDWDANGGLPEGDIFGQLTQENALCRLPVVDGLPLKDQHVPEPLKTPKFTARFERPYLLHGALAPSAAMACWKDRVLTITCHSQGIYALRDAVADSIGLETDAVVVTHMPGSGCYGHNGADDAAFDAALIAHALPGRPVLLKWSREDEHAWEPVAPAMAVETAADLDTAGRVSCFSAEVLSGTHRGRPRAGPNRAGPARLLANQLRTCDVPTPETSPTMNRQSGMHRNLDPIYSFPDKRLVKNLVDGLPHRTSAYRCLGATSNIFALECMMDALAKDAGVDPITYRIEQLHDGRASRLLDRLREVITTRPPLPETGGRGIAYVQYKNTMTRVGLCVDIDVADTGEILLQHAIIVADAGRILDRDGVTAQLEGGFIQGASIALSEELSWDREGIQSRDWESYPVIRFNQIPSIEVVLIEAQHEPSVGAGEAAPGPAIAAIANALFDATGMRLTRLPLTPEAIIRHAATL